MTTNEQNAKNAAIELEHILLELKNKRTQHLRHFVDQYFCYTHDLVTKSGRARWEGMVWGESVSIQARNSGDRKQIVKEHVVPVKIITTLLAKLGPETTHEAIKLLLDKYLLIATISKDEDNKLRKDGLSRRMPDGFYTPGHEHYNDLFSRYRAVNIQLEPTEKRKI